ncbi:3-oxoacid CoA-transferase subunit A [Novosphingobium sp. 9U]|uniref:3-oxoacid CoA-transferase subunit A n=1 Tax=Novosphingobium sp. 9U TaxID=2653158 RepID=UPI0012F07A33|nr:3-oxoacid CoA-transferase subunit A [Novosphingobium sp. 9U]VWX54168.1 acetyl-CoA:acetoacetyl-CoA transferase, alpha subunit [Novosphingobium sp. 9U]
MINKIVSSFAEAVQDLRDGSAIMISGFGEAGVPAELIEAVVDHGATDLTIISNNAGTGEIGIAALIKANRVRKVICSYPRMAGSTHFEERYRSGDLELELVPQGNLAARIQAAGSGLGAIFTPTGYGTMLAEGKETREIDGKHYVLEYPIHADFALVKARAADRWGNLVYRKAGRNFGPIMAMAGKQTIVQVDEIDELGTLDPETVVTPGIFVDRVVLASAPAAKAA